MMTVMTRGDDDDSSGMREEENRMLREESDGMRVRMREYDDSDDQR